MAAGEEPAVLALVMRGFEELVRPDVTEAGVTEFARAARSFVIDRPAEHHVMVAERDGCLLGMIDVRDSCHVSLFFVESAERRRGVGRALLQSAQDLCASRGERPVELTVNSSPWAVAVYQRLGFTATAPLQERDGIRYVPTAKRT